MALQKLGTVCSIYICLDYFYVGGLQRNWLLSGFINMALQKLGTAREDRLSKEPYYLRKRALLPPKSPAIAAKEP